MRSLLVVIILLLFNSAQAITPYQLFLLEKAMPHHSEHRAISYDSPKPQVLIPHYEIPKGAVFCRMEDKLSKATHVWIKIGVK